MMVRERPARRYTGDKSPCDLSLRREEKVQRFLAEAGNFAIPAILLIMRA
jgi:hypothetical protein